MEELESELICKLIKSLRVINEETQYDSGTKFMPNIQSWSFEHERKNEER